MLQAKIGRAVNTDRRLHRPARAEPLHRPRRRRSLGRRPRHRPGEAGREGRRGGDPGVPAKPPKTPTAQARGRHRSSSAAGRLIVDGKPFFFRAIRHTGTPLHVLRQAGFDTLWLPADAPDDLLDEANREGWLVVPTIPLGRGAARTSRA